MLQNFIVLAIFVPKIIKLGGNLTKLWQKIFWTVFWDTVYKTVRDTIQPIQSASLITGLENFVTSTFWEFSYNVMMKFIRHDRQ